MSSSVCDWISKLCALWNSIHINLSEAFGEMQICSSFFNVDKKKSPPPLIARQIRPSTARNTSLSKKKYICSYVCCWLLRPFLAFGFLFWYTLHRFHAASYHVSQCYLWPLSRASILRTLTRFQEPFDSIQQNVSANTEMNRPSQVLGEKASWAFGLYFV